MAGSATPMPAPPSKAVKPIKFVNNEGRPPAKRRRINAACQTCRKRKIRCDGKKPICSTCTENGHTCLGYTDPVQQSRHLTAAEDRASEDEESGENWPTGTGKIDAQTVPQSYRASVVPENSSPPGFGEYGQRQSSASEGASNRSPMLNKESHASPTVPAQGRRVPFFRYFGPTAIVPGYKQMVVSLRDRKNTTGGQSGQSPASGGLSDGEHYDMGRSSHSGSEPPSRPDLPFYDQTDPAPVNSLIRHLVEIFFTHVGCNFPFLQRDKFEHMVAEKKVEAILVNAVCALAARFSDHPLLTCGHDIGRSKSDYGSVYAQRAKNAVIDTFPCPTVAAVQACVLLGYESFGADQDSALWMYTGCAIRMAVDLGLQKIDGVKGADASDSSKDDDGHPRNKSSSPSNGGMLKNTPAEDRRQKAVEQERCNTLWAVLMLDRVISAGTGRPVSLRNEDFELSFPEVTRNAETGWPAPFPALIQMINLYGRVSDLLNNIRDASDLTQEKMAGLSGMENEVTQLYQKLDPRLTFNAANFQHYVKCGEGTNFILLHFWFHTLIMLLHQPMLLHSVHGGQQQIMPNSRELSMSSAKTVADILAFAELIDPKSFVGSPFTCQPMYTAACAFLMESRTSSKAGSKGMSPPPRHPARGETKHEGRESGSGHIQDLKTAKQNYLAAAANQNYQRCYNGLVQLQTYWGGTKYIITALDQRAKGIWDPETFTTEEMASTKMSQSNALKDWKSRLPANVTIRSPSIHGIPFYTGMDLPGSPSNDPNQLMGWSLTGTTNSPSSNLAFLYQSMGGDFQPAAQQAVSGNMVYDPIRQSVPENTNATTAPYSQNSNTMPYGLQNRFPRSRYTGQLSPYSHLLPPSSGSTPTPSISDAEMLLGLQQPSPYSPSTSHPPSASTTTNHHHRHQQQNYSQPQVSSDSNSPGHNRHSMPLTSQQSDPQPGPPAAYDFAYNDGISSMNGYNTSHFNTSGIDGLGLGRFSAGEMMIESQDIDMSAFGTEMMPWLDFLPQDVLGWGDNSAPKEEWP